MAVMFASLMLALSQPRPPLLESSAHVAPSLRAHSHMAVSSLLALRGGDSMPDQTVQAYEWAINVATAAALVAGGSLASMFDHGVREDPSKSNLRMLSLVLLALSFAFEVCVVFTGTVTGTMLLSGGRAIHPFNPYADSATHLLQRELEFEYCLIRAGFFQGRALGTSLVARF